MKNQLFSLRKLPTEKSEAIAPARRCWSSSFNRVADKKRIIRKMEG
jgi:hypothetical protein